MSRPEQPEIHPSWVRAIDAASTRRGRFQPEERLRRRSIREQTTQRYAARSRLLVGNRQFADLIDFFFQDEVREVKFREATNDFLKRKSHGLQVLVINHGDPFHDLSLPAELARYSSKIDFFGEPPLYNADVIEECNELFNGSCTFGEISQQTFRRTDHDAKYDLILIYRDSEEGRDNPRESLIESRTYAGTLRDKLRPGGSIIASADESLDNLRPNLHDLSFDHDELNAKLFGNTVFVSLHSGNVYIPIDKRTKRNVWAITSKNGENTRQSRMHVPRTRKGWLGVGAGAAALGIGITAGILLTDSSPGSNATNSPESSQSLLNCTRGEIQVYPSSIVSNTPNQFTFVYHPPHEQELTIVDKDNQLTFSQLPWGVTSPVPAVVGKTYVLPTGPIHIGKNTILFCETTPKPVHNATGPSTP